MFMYLFIYLCYVIVSLVGYDPMTKQVLVTRGGISQLDFDLHPQLIAMEYHHYSQIVEALRETERRFPEIAHVYRLDESILHYCYNHTPQVTIIKMFKFVIVEFVYPSPLPFVNVNHPCPAIISDNFVQQNG